MTPSSYSDPYSPEERQQYSEIVATNAIQSMQVRLSSPLFLPPSGTDLSHPSPQAVLRGADIVNVQIPQSLFPYADFLLNTEPEDGYDVDAHIIDPKVKEAIVALWEAPETKQIVKLSSAFQLNECVSTFPSPPPFLLFRLLTTLTNASLYLPRAAPLNSASRYLSLRQKDLLN
jgi:hypothetical protein